LGRDYLIRMRNYQVKPWEANPPAAKPQVSVVVPTYNERENVPALLGGLRRALNGRYTFQIIVVDDNSPDGTAEAVRRAADGDSSTILLVRPAKMGLASALVDGFKMAQGEYLVMMDGDLSHRPEDLPGLLDRLAGSDIAVGSRYVPGARTLGWPLHRRIMSRLAATAARAWLGIRVQDVTSGFAAFRRESLEPLLPSLNATGFKLLVEILARSRNASVVEHPILFVDRRRGHSKLDGGEVMAFLSLCFNLRRM
jgi:dolichol-phosphate mannosyltransferase